MEIKNNGHYFEDTNGDMHEFYCKVDLFILPINKKVWIKPTLSYNNKIEMKILNDYCSENIEKNLISKSFGFIIDLQQLVLAQPIGSKYFTNRFEYFVTYLNCQYTYKWVMKFNVITDTNKNIIIPKYIAKSKKDFEKYFNK